MADKDSKKGEAKNPAIAKTLNKVEERLDMEIGRASCRERV